MKYLSRYKKEPHIPFQCLIPLPESGPTGNTGLESAFRAIKTTDQSISANALSIITFETIEFDLNNEYDRTSTFSPQQDGVYLIIAAVTFEPTDISVNYVTQALISVNNSFIAGSDNFMGGNSGFLNAVNPSTIVQLQAGDVVRISASSSVAGQFLAVLSHFEATRLPSPASNPSSPITISSSKINKQTFDKKL
ncbi:exosporium leader peptide [Bacillus mycoides]|uniref:exosporium leader peptide n=1 Tax=Bacillus mycoides TaxID=1405 RepID=UPI000323691F|nr:exosporium leader peptide [Bacillus mycoides]